MTMKLTGTGRQAGGRTDKPVYWEAAPPKMNFNENDLWKDKTELLNLILSKLTSTKVLLKLEFDTEDQVLS